MDWFLHIFFLLYLNILTIQINSNEVPHQCNFSHSNPINSGKNHLLTEEHPIFYKVLLRFFYFYVHDFFLIHILFISWDQRFIFRILIYYLIQNGEAFLEFWIPIIKLNFALKNYCNSFDSWRNFFNNLDCWCL